MPFLDCEPCTSDQRPGGVLPGRGLRAARVSYWGLCKSYSPPGLDGDGARGGGGCAREGERGSQAKVGGRRLALLGPLVLVLEGGVLRRVAGEGHHPAVTQTAVLGPGRFVLQDGIHAGGHIPAVLMIRFC